MHIHHRVCPHRQNLDFPGQELLESDSDCLLLLLQPLLQLHERIHENRKGSAEAIRSQQRLHCYVNVEGFVLVMTN